jgi:hypothetical protein
MLTIARQIHYRLNSSAEFYTSRTHESGSMPLKYRKSVNPSAKQHGIIGFAINVLLIFVFTILGDFLKLCDFLL